MKATPTNPWQTFITLGLALGVFAAPAAALAGPLLERLLHRDVDVISVTDVSEEGKSQPEANPDSPVRYLLIYAGEMSPGATWAGESIPPNQVIIQWLMSSLKNRGYLPADRKHPAQQVLVFGWGTYPGSGSLRTVGFLGGAKTNLLWGDYRFGDLSPTGFHTPNMIRTHLEHKIADFAQSNLFIGMLRSYAMDSLNDSRPTKLWETRFACLANGLALDETMPLLIKAASLNFGRETLRPVNLNASDAFDGRVDLPDFEVLGEYKTPDDTDLPAGARKLVTEMTRSRL